MSENPSLFGWPMPEAREAGRPEHVATDENRNKVMMLLAFKYTNREIAGALGVSQPTLRKHYLQELSQRRLARLQLDGQRFGKLYERAIVDGEVSALRELGKEMKGQDLQELAASVAQRGTKKQDPKKGKKEQQREAAGEVGGKYAPPAPPTKLFN